MARRGKSDLWADDGGVIREDTAAQRGAHGDKERKRRERAQRRAARAGARRKAISIVVAIVIVAVGAVLVVQRTRSLNDETATTPVTTSAPKAATTTSGLGGTTTTSEQALRALDYQRGDCVLWDRLDTTSALLPTTKVPCDQPHLVEMVAWHLVPQHVTDYPDDRGWNAVFAEVCDHELSEYLTSPLDPNGLYYSSGLHPTRLGWATGDHTMWCGVGRRPRTPAEFQMATTGSIEFVGTAVGQSQDLLYDVGTCFTNQPFAAVECTNRHDLEITGTVELTGRIDEVPDRGDSRTWQTIVGDECATDALAYLGRFPDDGLRPGWLPALPESFAAGRRTAQCTLSRWQGDTTIPLDGPLRGVAA